MKTETMKFMLQVPEMSFLIVNIVLMNMDGKQSIAQHITRFYHCGKESHFATMCLQRKDAGKRDYTTTPHVYAVSKSSDDILCVDYDAQGYLHIHTISES